MTPGGWCESWGQAGVGRVVLRESRGLQDAPFSQGRGSQKAPHATPHSTPRFPSERCSSRSVSSSVLLSPGAFLTAGGMGEPPRHVRMSADSTLCFPLIPRGSRYFSVPSLHCKLRGGGTMAFVGSLLCAKSGFKCFPCILWRELQQKWRSRPAPALLTGAL